MRCPPPDPVRGLSREVCKDSLIELFPHRHGNADGSGDFHEIDPLAARYVEVFKGGNALQFFSQPRKAYVLLHAEPELDCHDPQQAFAAMRAAELVVAFSAFRHRALEYAQPPRPQPRRDFRRSARDFESRADSRKPVKTG